MTHTPSRSAALLLSLMFALPAWAQQPATTIPLYAGQPMEGGRVTYGDMGWQKPFEAEAGAAQSNEAVNLRRSGKDGAADALQLTWKDLWMTMLRVDSPPLDLRPYLAKGTLAFDLKVNDLAKGGLYLRLECGHLCERKVGLVLPARAAQGKGWTRFAYPLSCFHHDGDDISKVTKPFAFEAMGSGDVEVANIRIEKAGVPTASCPDYRTVSVTPGPQQESWSLDWWMPRHQEKLAEIARRRAAKERTDLVFIGDSITHGWENDGRQVWERLYKPHNALNLGYGGDRTENVLWRLQNGEIDGIEPKVAVLMIGTNNTGLRLEDPALTLAGIKRDIAELKKRLPRTKILLLAIFPREEKPDGTLRQMNEKINQVLPKLADGKKVFFLNINQAFLGADGAGLVGAAAVNAGAGDGAARSLQ